MGCAPPSRHADPDPRFAGLGVDVERGCRYRACLAQMDRLRLPYLTHHALLAGFARERQWCLCLHFADWPVPVTAAIVDNLLLQFRRACAAWLRHLRGRDGFPAAPIAVRVFGFVFETGCEVGPSFLARYGRYPRVTEWSETSENCPWTIAGAPATGPKWYDPNLDLHSVRVTGNRSHTGATFHPSDWTDYRHPEGLRGFQTRYWHGTAWHAVAQRHYLRVGGVCTDAATGSFGARYPVLLHEMGHCFFLDDLYDARKYPSPLPPAAPGCTAVALRPEDSVMHSCDRLTPLDHAMLRHAWERRRR